MAPLAFSENYCVLRQHIDNLANNSIQELQRHPKQVIYRFNESMLEMSRLDLDPKNEKNRQWLMVSKYVYSNINRIKLML